MRNVISISNRLPIVYRETEASAEFVSGSGGLVTALSPILKKAKGAWIGWPGVKHMDEKIDTALDALSEKLGFQLRGLALDESEIENFYQGFSNEIIWPLFHDFHNLCNFNPDYWHSYRSVNRKYAMKVSQSISGDEFIWVHDYHLMHVGLELSKLGVTNQTSFFLHIPFPSYDIFSKLPWRKEILNALMYYDTIGFQTDRDKNNFLHCVEQLMEGFEIEKKGNITRLVTSNNRVSVGAFPISIDYKDFEQRAAAAVVTNSVSELKASLPNRQLIIGVDRLDYTKGIPQRLMAFQNALRRYPDLLSRITLVQVIVPSRENIPQYANLKAEIERLISEINGEFTQPGGWVPIHYVFRSLEDNDLLTYYRAAEMALITPLKDGMNLVAKEYCASNIDENAVLILSEFAGAAQQLKNGAIIVNPYDIESVADAIHEAFVLPVDQRAVRMHAMRESIRRNDVFAWINSLFETIKHDTEMMAAS